MERDLDRDGERDRERERYQLSDKNNYLSSVVTTLNFLMITM